MATAGGPNWLGLLQWSLAHSDGTRPVSEVKKMSEEDRKWLEAVMRDNVKDEPARMNEIMTEIVAMLESQSCVENEERIEFMLEELRDMTEQIDMAQIFVKFGGLACLLGLLDSPEPLNLDTRCLAVGAIGTLSQNNLIVQEGIFNKGVVDKLSLVVLTTDSFVLSAKVLFAISCIVRNLPAAEVHFGMTYGPKVFEKSISSGKANLATRAVFLSNALITSDDSSVELIAAIAPSFLPGCFSFVWGTDTDLRESTLRLLVSFAKTTTGRALIISNNEALETAFEQRKTAIAADADSAQQALHEESLISEFRQALEGAVSIPRPRPTKVPKPFKSDEKTGIAEPVVQEEEKKEVVLSLL